MELHARLVHAEDGLRVVEVRASRGERNLGSTLAEAATVQEAEDLAITRLLRRLEHQGGAGAAAGPGFEEAATHQRALRRRSAPITATVPTEPPKPDLATTRSAMTLPQRDTAWLADDSEALGPATAVEDHQPVRATSAADAPLPSRERPARPLDGTEPLQRDVEPPAEPQEEPPADPEDWSQELTAIDLQLRRLGWNREQEGLYLQRAFGHPSRSRLTRYSDVRAYLLALEALERGSDPAVAAVPLRRSELLAQGDALLAQLGWSAEQGRAFLERELQRTSRQQLSDVQLLQFNMLLEGELLAGDAPMAP
jgi:hypothetical protein